MKDWYAVGKGLGQSGAKGTPSLGNYHQQQKIDAGFNHGRQPPPPPAPRPVSPPTNNSGRRY